MGLVEGGGKREGKEEDERRFVFESRKRKMRAHTQSPGEGVTIREILEGPTAGIYVRLHTVQIYLGSRPDRISFE